MSEPHRPGSNCLRSTEFLAEAKKLKMDVGLVTGEEAEKVLRDAIAAPKQVIDRVKEALERK